MSTAPTSKEDCICRVLRDASRAITNAYDRALAPSGIRTTQFTLLSVLARQSAATVNQLSELLGIDQTTTTRNVNVLEEAGLIMRVAHHDPRVKLVKLTAKGKQKRLVAAECWQSMQAAVTSSVRPDDWEIFKKVLHEIETSCNATE